MGFGLRASGFGIPDSATGGRRERARRSRDGMAAIAAAGLAATTAAAVVALAAGCGESAAPKARAYRIGSRSETVGGPAALAEVGDWVLENGVIRAAFLAEGNSVGPGMFGGSLVDIDLVRRDGRHPPGRGNDQFSELFPMANLVIPGYVDDPRARTRFADLDVAVVETDGTDWCEAEGFDAGCAALRVRGKGDRIIEALGAIAVLSVPMNLSFETVFVLEPGRDYLRIRTDAYVNNMYQEGTPARELATVGALVDAGLGVIDVLVGDALGPAAERVWEPGFLAGDFLMFGKKLAVFSEGAGYDFPNLFQRMYDAGLDMLGHPVASDALVGVGDGVSYAYASIDGPTIVPIFTGAFTGVFTHYLRCAAGDAVCATAQRAPLRYERVLTVGRGDVASALAPLYRLRREHPGILSGHVYDRATGDPISGAQVFVIGDLDPGGEHPATAERLMRRNRGIGGDPGIVTEMRTDLRGDDDPDGSFSGPVPPGTYYVVVRAPDRELSVPARVRVYPGNETTVSLPVERPGAVRYEVFDDRGGRGPAKLTFIGPLGPDDPCGRSAPAGAVPDLTAQSAARPLPLGGGEMPSAIAAVAFTTDGIGEVRIQPGRYDLWISRGFEYSVDRQCVDVRPGDPARVVGFLMREVDTTGYIATDHHIHGLNSYDAETAHAERIASALAEGMEYITISDHDYITDLDPTLRQSRLDHMLVTDPSVEVTPIETGHFIGFPLRYDHLLPEHGALDWTRRDECLGHTGDPEWPWCNYAGTDGLVLPLLPAEIFDRLRDLGELRRERTVVVVPHPRDGFFGYFDQFGLDQFDLSFLPSGLVRGQHPVLADPDSFFSLEFDALELFNSKRFEMIRTPTTREIVGFAYDLRERREDPAATESDVARTHLVYAREVLTRTRSEQEALRMGVAPECADATGCAAGEMCDRQRGLCVPEGAACRSDPDCPAHNICSFEVRPYRCVAECETDADCRLDSYCDTTTSDRGRCVRRNCAATEAPDAPCTQNGTPAVEGVVDDWFRLLNRGIVKAGIGGSDSHSLDTLETGCPRNFVASSTDDPGAVDAAEISDSIRPLYDENGLVRGPRVIATYGPFVELFVNGLPIGSVVPIEGTSVEVETRVQWPSWFDVDRVELYRNGELILVSHPGRASQGFLLTRFTDDDLPVDSGGAPVDFWYVAVAMGTDPASRSLSPVYTANRHPNLGFSQVVALTLASIDDPLLQAVVPAPLPLPEQVPVIPYGITNPVFVDANGVPGFQGPLGSLPVGSSAPPRPGVPPSTGSSAPVGEGGDEASGPAAFEARRRMWRLRLMLEGGHGGSGPR